jgi:hypothetical protein
MSSAGEFIGSRRENRRFKCDCIPCKNSMKMDYRAISYYMYAVASDLERLTAVAMPYSLRYKMRGGDKQCSRRNVTPRV